MDTRKIAIACQGGGIHGAFTCGVLDNILRAKEDEENGTGAQQWRWRNQSSLINPQSGRCLDVTTGSTADGTRLQISRRDPGTSWTSAQ